MEPMRWEEFDWLIEAAFAEDSVRRDVTSEALIDAALEAEAQVVAREAGVICGLALAGHAS